MLYNPKHKFPVNSCVVGFIGGYTRRMTRNYVILRNEKNAKKKSTVVNWYVPSFLGTDIWIEQIVSQHGCFLYFFRVSEINGATLSLSICSTYATSSWNIFSASESRHLSAECIFFVLFFERDMFFIKRFDKTCDFVCWTTFQNAGKNAFCRLEKGFNWIVRICCFGALIRGLQNLEALWKRF